MQLYFVVHLYLGQATWDQEGISLEDGAPPDPFRPELHEMQAAFEVVFTDGSGYLNITADMTSATLSVVCNNRVFFSAVF